MGNPSQSYGASLAIWDHTVLPATRHMWTCPAVTPARQADTRFTYPGGMESWVDLGSLIVVWPGIEPTTTWLQVQRPNRYATKPYRLMDSEIWTHISWPTTTESSHSIKLSFRDLSAEANTREQTRDKDTISRRCSRTTGICWCSTQHSCWSVGHNSNYSCACW